MAAQLALAFSKLVYLIRLKKGIVVWEGGVVVVKSSILQVWLYWQQEECVHVSIRYWKLVLFFGYYQSIDFFVFLLSATLSESDN